MISKLIINLLRLEVEKKFCKPVEFSSDFNSLSTDIQKTTTGRISISTLKRIWQYVGLEVTPRIYTLNVLAQYAGFISWAHFKEFIEPFVLNSLKTENKKIKHLITKDLDIQFKIRTSNNVHCKIESIGNNNYKIIESGN